MAEKQLIQVLTGKEIPSGSLPSSQGIIMHNIATCFAIADAVINDTPLIKRVTTVTGLGLNKPQNVWALLGTPVNFLLEQCELQTQNNQRVIMGGPMMGFTLPSGNVPVVKITNCVLAPSDKEIAVENKEVECIRCGQCADVCPAQLLPQELQWHAKAKDHQQLEALNLFDCIECGACAYVCPSHIPLVHYYRIGKAEIREQKQLELKAEKAKVRFEARKLRLERDKKAREEKQRKAAEARKAKMHSGTAEAKSEMSAVAAALARVKAKKAQTANTEKTLEPVKESTQETTQATNNEAATKLKNPQIAAAIARAKAKKLANQNKENTEAEAANVNTPIIKEPAEISPDDKKAKVAAAIAKAKAKKLTKASSLPTDESISLASEDDKKTKTAAAIAKAKAKKLAKASPLTADESISLASEDKKIDDVIAVEESQVPAPEVNAASEINTASKDDKKAKVAAAIAKAKAKKLAKASPLTADESIPLASEDKKIDDVIAVEESQVPAPEVNATPEDDKKARIARAIAKARAKKEQAKQDDTEDKDYLAEQKKKRIAEAVAKAKAKKQQRTELN